MKTLSNFAALCLAASVFVAPALAQQQSITLAGDVMVEKIEVDASGASRTVLAKPDIVVPGDRLVFGTDYRNEGGETVTDFVVTNPLPGAVRLAPDADAALMVSVDGGNSWGALRNLEFKLDDGTSRPAEHADVTHIQWTLAAVEPGASGRLEYPAIIR